MLQKKHGLLLTSVKRNAMGSEKIRKIKLKVDDDPCCSIYGLVSPEPAYKLCLELNNLLGSALRNDTPVAVYETGENKILFTRFSDFETAPWKWISLVSNRSESKYLIKKLANIDYLLLHFDETDEEHGDKEFAASVRKSDLINGIFSVDMSLIDKNILESLTPNL